MDDTYLSGVQIEELVEEVFKDNDVQVRDAVRTTRTYPETSVIDTLFAASAQGRGQLNHVDLVAPVTGHALFNQFIQGKGTVRYGAGK